MLCDCLSSLGAQWVTQKTFLVKENGGNGLKKAKDTEISGNVKTVHSQESMPKDCRPRDTIRQRESDNAAQTRAGEIDTHGQRTGLPVKKTGDCFGCSNNCQWSSWAKKGNRRKHLQRSFCSASRAPCGAHDQSACNKPARAPNCAAECQRVLLR